MYFIGIDLGGTAIKTGIVNQDGKIITKTSIQTKANRDNMEIMKDIADSCHKVCKIANIKFEDIAAIGMGTPGLVQNGVIRFAGNLGFNNLNAAKILTEMLSADVYVANDANVAALGEVMCGGGVGYKNAAVLTLGTGLGLGIIIDGKIFVGSNGGAGEFGHTIVEKNGHQCSCGNKGCIETYTSATALIRDTKLAMEKDRNSLMWNECGGNIENAGGRTAFNAYYKGDKAAIEVIENYTDYVAIAIANVVNIIEPEIVLIGGGISGEGEGLMEPLRKKASAMLFGNKAEVKQPKIEKAILGNDAGLIGAAMFGKKNGITV